MSFLSTAPMRSSSWLDEKRHSFKLLSQKMTALHEECPRDRKTVTRYFSAVTTFCCLSSAHRTSMQTKHWDRYAKSSQMYLMIPLIVAMFRDESAS